MRIQLDLVGGIAGDMFVAAMLDAFPSLRDHVLNEASSVIPHEAGEVFLREGASGAVRCLRFGLDAHHHHHHEPHDPGHHHHHTAEASYPDLMSRIASAPISAETVQHASAILTILAKAEARIHGVALENVHFHELADWDSLLDVVAAGSIATALEGASWSVSSLPRGSGLVRTQHGLLPVPVPATVEILRGFDWRDDGVAGERVTPTGAAILRHLVRPETMRTHGKLRGSGTGAGTRDLPGMPNIVRALVFTPSGSASDHVVVISFEIDDMSGEEIGVATDRLRSLQGVLDLSIAQRWGKKGRPVQSICILVLPDHADALMDACFQQTSTIGLRFHEEQRRVLKRASEEDEGIRIKRVERPGGVSTVKVESDDLSSDSLHERRTLKAKLEEK